MAKVEAPAASAAPVIPGELVEPAPPRVKPVPPTAPLKKAELVIEPGFVPPAAPSAPASPPPLVPLGSSPDDKRPILATLDILNEGPTKGSRYALRTSLVHLGRGEHNDVVLTDESVSETHAKLQRREDGWYLVDMESTNGTYAGGARVKGERKLDGSPDLRFGGVKMRFTPAGRASEADGKGTRAIAAVDRPRQSTARTPAPAEASEAKPAAGGIPAWVWIVAVLVIAAAAFFVLKGGA
jgi:hypothetical protein